MNAVIETLPLVDPAPVVHKFGGSSLATPETIRQCVAILEDETAVNVYVVVSAARGVTDALLGLVEDAASGRAWQNALRAQRRRQQRLIRELLSGDAATRALTALDADCSSLRETLHAFSVLKAATPRASDAVVACGETWSMRLLAALLDARGLSATVLDARRFLCASRDADEVSIDWEQSAERFASIERSARFTVVPGFVARAPDGATLTLGRNGSDWSATLLAKLADARSITIWTDTAGVFDADPRVVANAVPQPLMSRDAAGELAAHGARVLHPATLAPLAGSGIGVRVRSTFAPEAPGTWIVKNAGLPDAIVAASADVVSVIGRRIDTARAIAALHDARLSPQQIRSHAQSLHVNVDSTDAARAQRILHRALCARSNRASLTVAVLGTGSVGSELLRLLAKRDAYRVVAAANSRAMLLDANGLVPVSVARTLARTRDSSDLSRLAAFLLAHCEAAPVIVDATASETTARLHAEWLVAGIHVVTANKLAAANGWTGQPGMDVFYGDAATVGAGLPVLSTLRRLRAAGDSILHVEGVLSGSLACILHDVGRGRSFSRAVLAARRAGFTEPDPRHDLAGTDVARKLAIVATAAGIPLAFSLEPESLLPPSLLATPFDAIDLRPVDAHWRDRARDADRRGEVLRHVARVEASGEACIGVRSVAVEHPLAQTHGADNCVCIHSTAYRDPLVIRGPGAGALVTARALLADLDEVRARFGG